MAERDTKEYIDGLIELKAGALGLLRNHAGRRLDETLDGFDLFAGLWWPLRQKNQRAPRREVAWLIAKIYAFRPIEHSPGNTLAAQLARCLPFKDVDKKRFTKRFDRLLTLPLDKIETDLRWALDVVDANVRKLDWVKLTDDLSSWERESTRFGWAEEFLNTNQGGQPC